MFKFLFFVPLLLLGSESPTFYPIISDSIKLQPSGLSFIEGKLIALNKNEDTALYELTPQKDHYEVKPWKKLILSDSIRGQKKFPLDLEGLTSCNGDLYITDNRDRFIYEVKGSSLELSKYAIDPSFFTDQINNVFSNIPNAGFKGVACDGKNKLLYVFNDRQYRRIFEISIKDFHINNSYDVPSGSNLPKIDNSIEIFPDFSDAAFENGHLYVIYRNDFKILKIHTKTKSIVADLSYPNESQFYDSRSYPFGMAEGIALDKNYIYLSIDNNGMNLKNGKSYPGILRIKRTEGF